jgi:hypothetical protein
MIVSDLDPATNYATVQEEMIVCMNHGHDTFRTDNIKVWEIIQDSLHETKAMMGVLPIWRLQLITSAHPK